jgi:TP901 family phage tail tape measure protein
MSRDLTLSLKIGATLASGFKSTFSAAKREIGQLEAGAKRVGTKLGAAYKAQAARYKENGGTGLGGVAGFAGAAYAFAQPIKQAIAFETAMLGVAKQVEGARDAGGKLTPVYTGMRKEIQMLGREIPIATNELAAMAEAGARMGIAKQDLIGFTKQAAIMASAFGLPAAELADDMGKIANLYKIPIPAIGKLGDTINYLDDNAIAKGGDIINFLTRVGGVAASVKITGNNMAALGSTLLTLGETTDTASTATNAIFQKFAAAESGTKPFKQAMDQLGLSLSDVQKGMQVDAQGTLLEVLDAINTMPADQRLGILADLVGLEHSDTLAKLASGVAEYRKQIQMAGSDKAQGSMSREFSARLGTTAAQLEIMGNRVGEVGVGFGTVLLPALNMVLQPMAAVATWAADVVEQFPGVVYIVGALAAGVAGYATYVGTAAAAQWAWNAALTANPIGLVVAGLTAFGALAYTVYKNWEPIMGWFQEKFAWLGKSIDWVKGLGSSLSNGSTGSGGRNGPSKAGFLGPVPAKSLPSGLNLSPTQAQTPSVTTNAPINIYQQPGENSDTLARRISDQIKRQSAADQRRALHD